MTASRLRSLALSLLVVVSLLLSFSIWHGDWLNRSEAAISDVTSTTSTTTSALPVMATTEIPYEVVLKTGKGPGYSVDLPGTNAYNNWLQRLAALSINGLKPMLQSGADTAPWTVQIQFGNTLDRTALVSLIPALRNDAFAEQTQTVTLYQTDPGQPVMLELSAPNQPDHYTGRTSMTPQEFQALLSTAAETNPWLLFDTSQVSGYLPEKQIRIHRYVWKSQQPATVQLIHSFFLQPNALTRIQEDTGDVLWTDGSRAVQWSPVNGTMTFNDPNAATTGAGVNSLATAVSFIQNHGGSRTNLVPFGPYAEQQSTHTVTYVLSPEVDGLPVLAADSAYQITLTNGHVTKYVRPTIDQSVGKVTSAQTMPGFKLSDIIQQQFKPSQQSHLKLVFGYTVITNAAGKMRLEPAVDIIDNTGTEFEVDAVTGQVLKGGSGS